MPLKRKILSFAAKNELIEKLEKSNLSKAAFIKAICIPWITLNSILAAKLCISNFEINQERKHQSLSLYENLDKVLLL